MRSRALFVLILLLAGSPAFGQSYDMIIHLSGGESVSVPSDDIRCIRFVETGVQDPGDPEHGSPLFRLLQSYPNPFRPSTTIAYDIPAAAVVVVRIYGLEGALVKELLRETQVAGPHRVIWDGTDCAGERVASGVYFCEVECGEQALSQKLILVK